MVDCNCETYPLPPFLERKGELLNHHAIACLHELM